MSGDNTCKGCNGSWKRASDLVQHHIKTTDQNCRKAANDVITQLRRSRFGPRRSPPSSRQHHKHQIHPVSIEVDEAPQTFAGDFFGDDYSSADFPGFEPNSDALHKAGREESESDEEEDPEDPDIGIESHWEPERQSVHMDVDSEHQPEEPISLDTHNPNLNPLLHHLPAHRDDIHVVSFGGHAGAPIPQADGQPQTLQASRTGFAQYQSHIPNSKENLWAPFASKADWELACWAKLRGPGSTAFSELLDIEGVCVLYVRYSVYLQSMTLLDQ